MIRFVVVSDFQQLSKGARIKIVQLWLIKILRAIYAIKGGKNAKNHEGSIATGPSKLENARNLRVVNRAASRYYNLALWCEDLSKF